MKVIATETAFYNKKLVEEGEVIDIEEKEVPSWAKKIKEDKTPKNKQEVNNKIQSNQKQNIETQPTRPTSPTKEPETDNEELKAELEILKDTAIDNNIIIEVDENASVKQNIETFKKALKEKGIDV